MKKRRKQREKKKKKIRTKCANEMNRKSHPFQFIFAHLSHFISLFLFLFFLCLYEI